MKYFAKASNVKSSTSRINAVLTEGVCLPHLRKKNCAREIINFSSDMYPWLASRERFRRKFSSANYSSGAGVYNKKTYYIKDGKFCYHRVEKFDVSQGKKQFYHYNGKIVIFPDMIYYDPEKDIYGRFGVTTNEITYKILNRSVGSVDFGLSCVQSEDLVLTDYFKVGDGIKITDEEGLGISGFHTITAVNKEEGILYFDKFEFGDGEGFTLVGRLSHGAPERCDAACVCGGRVWVAAGNKIHASTINDECNWAVGGDDEKSSFVCTFDNGESITACVELEGSPVFFSEKKIYKVYGDRASNFYLKCCSNWGGIPKGMSDTVAVMKDKIYYISDYGVTYFDGSLPRVVPDAPLPTTQGSFAASGGEKYYIFIPNQDKYLYVYDDKNGQWQKHGGQHEFVAFVKYQGALYACTESEMVSLYGDSDIFLSYGFEDIPYHFVDFCIDVNGCRPLRIGMSLESNDEADYEIYISYDSEEERRLIKTVRGTFSGNFETLLVPKSCGSMTIGIGGEGMIIIKDIYVDVIH